MSATPATVTLQPGFYAIDGFGSVLTGPSLTQTACKAAAIVAGVSGAFEMVYFPSVTEWSGWTTTSVPAGTTVNGAAVPLVPSSTLIGG